MSSTSNDPTGYLSPAYLRALGQQPLPLGQTGGHLALRDIPGGGQDLAGAYPLFTCHNWQALPEALASLPPSPVSLTLVADPFNPLGAEGLAAVFPICRHLHDHWVIDLTTPPAPSKHHRRKLRQSPPTRIEAGPPHPDLAPDWARLYAGLIDKKQITDARAFSPAALAAQLTVPGAQIVTAWEGTTLIGADLYYLDRGRAFAHLSAYAPEGYDRSVSYPMLAAALDHLRAMADVIDLGGAPSGAMGQGMAHFKSGWTDRTLPSYLCGKVLDPVAYAALQAGFAPTPYFPAYRQTDFQR